MLGLGDVEAKEMELEFLRESYRAEMRKSLADGLFSPEDRTKLEALATNFGLPQAVENAVYKDESVAVVQEAYNSAVADKRLTPDEEQRLAMISQNLHVKMNVEPETRSNAGSVPSLKPLTPSLQHQATVSARPATCAAQRGRRRGGESRFPRDARAVF